jgi:hypothetical protein
MDRRVADSSVIARVYFIDSQVTLGQATSRILVPYLRDAAGAYFAGSPTGYASSDDAVASITMQRMGDRMVAQLRGHAPGQATITASFLEARGTIQVTVVQ